MANQESVRLACAFRLVLERGPNVLCAPVTGELIPSSAVLVFDIHVIDFHNPKDPVQIQVIHKPEACSLTSEADDLIQYRYNCSLMDGTLLYSS